MTNENASSSADEEHLIVWYYDVTDTWLWATRGRHFITGHADSELEALEQGRKAIREAGV